VIQSTRSPVDAPQRSPRRFGEWTKISLWRKLHRVVLDELGSKGMIDWSRAVLDGACVRAKKGDL
jgi:hypothetical protein